MRNPYVHLLILVSLLGVGQAGATEIQERVKALPHAERAKQFRTVINSSGHPCPTVSWAKYMWRDREGMENYVATCTNGKSFIIGIKADRAGSTRVLDCDVARMVGVDCFAN